MAFTTWQAELERLKDAIANQPESELLQLRWTATDGQEVQFRKWEDLQKRLDYLEEKVQVEANAGGRRTGPFYAGYRGRGGMQ